MMDIDHFKKVNDNYGHVLGDQVLIEVAGLMGEEIREIDGLGRYGGEEFLVVLSGTESSEAFQVAERIRNRMQGMCCIRHSGDYKRWLKHLPWSRYT